jgi:hypothetical protein
MLPQRYIRNSEIEDLIPWWRKGDPAPPWVIDNETIFRRFVDVEVQFRIRELDILQQQIGLQKEKLAALNEVMAGKTK